MTATLHYYNKMKRGETEKKIEYKLIKGKKLKLKLKSNRGKY